MVASVTVPGSKPQTSTPHQYGTRIRSNSAIKPSVRLRQQTEVTIAPRRIKPAPTPKSKLSPVSNDALPSDLPPFPPEHVVLHSDDANNRVLLAIGRSFMSVDNRAMTIKDLAEMTLKYGLMCQNASAAGQAITSYIRAHLQRCEDQQDHPLLLRHVLSGTPSDDDLVPALHSRSGGAHCSLNTGDTRITNFRRGTMVWYLSKAAGVSCPFARAGIRLCDYNENGKVGTVPSDGKERKRERDRLRRAQQCGQKRKRLLRACADKLEGSDTSDDEQRPPKVKLTLRLRPSCLSRDSSLATGASQELSQDGPEIIDLSRDSESEFDFESPSDSESDSDSGSEDMSEDSSSDEESVDDAPQYAQQSVPSHISNPLGYASHLGRSPSEPVSSSSASPPPDSDEGEDEDSCINMLSHWRAHLNGFSDEDEQMSMDEDLFDFEDCNGDAETQWESPGPRSPSVHFRDEGVVVKQEPQDVGGLLDEWDDQEIRALTMKVVDVVTRAAAGLDYDGMGPKVKDPDPWAFDGLDSLVLHDLAISPVYEYAPYVKQEDSDVGVSLLMDALTPPPDISPIISPDPVSPTVSSSTVFSESLLAARRGSDFEWRDAELLGPDSVKMRDLDEDVWREGTRSTDHPASSSESSIHVAVSAISSQLTRTAVPPRLDLTTPTTPNTAKGGHSLSDLTSPSLLSSLTSLSLRTPTSPEVSRTDLISHSTPVSSRSEDPVCDNTAGRCMINPTCQPCESAITVTQLEGITVYQMTLDSSVILRRADTDFVNITSILQAVGTPQPYLHDTIVVNTGSAAVCGTWVPLSTAQDLFKAHPTLAEFLSGGLRDRFASELHQLPGSAGPSDSSSSSGQFGPSFQSTADAKQRSLSSRRLELADEAVLPPWEGGSPSQWDLANSMFAVHPTFSLTSAMLPTPVASLEEEELVETPLSPTEEEMFHVLYRDPEMDAEQPPLGAVATQLPEHAVEVALPLATTAKSKGPAAYDRPLRRSKRVADAIASRSRSRSSKKGSRSSLS